MPDPGDRSEGRSFRWIAGVVVPLVAALIAAGYWNFGRNHPSTPASVSDTTSRANLPVVPTTTTEAAPTKTPRPAPTKTPPPAPTDLAVSAATLSTVTLTWNGPDDIARYDVYRGLQLVGSTIGTTFVDGKDNSDGPLAAGASFTYKVVAIDSNGTASRPALTTAQTRAPDLTLTQLYNESDAAPKHRLTVTNSFPYGFTSDAAWRALSTDGADETQIFFCYRDMYDDHFVSTGSDCEHWVPDPDAGAYSFYVSTKHLPGTQRLYRCVSNSLNDHMLTTDPDYCNAEGSNGGTYHVEPTILGYAWPTT